MKYSELDRNNLLCPYCNKKVGSQPISVIEYYDPKFKHPGCADERGRGVTRVYLKIETPKGKQVDRKLRKNEVEVTLKKKRKPRSDAGKKRGKYAPRKK